MVSLPDVAMKIINDLQLQVTIYESLIDFNAETTIILNYLSTFPAYQLANLPPSHLL